MKTEQLIKKLLLWQSSRPSRDSSWIPCCH